MNRSGLVVFATFAIASLSGCNSQNPESKQIAREGEERDRAIEAARNHPAASGNPDATGQPLPPLPGIDTPAPNPEGDKESAVETGNEDHSAEHNHP